MLEIYGTNQRPDGWEVPNSTRPLDDAAKWAEMAGLHGMLIFTDQRTIDPWAAAQYMVERTERLRPLVAVQPADIPPYTAARMVATLATLYGRRVDLNLVAGGYPPDLASIGKFLEHDLRYERLVEYGGMLVELLENGEKVSRKGSHYELVDATLLPPMQSALMPRIFVAGTSAAAIRAARKLNATRLAYPRALEDHEDDPSALSGIGIRIGVLARDTAAIAWKIARERHPEDPWKEAFHEYASESIDSLWHKTLWSDSDRRLVHRLVYWLYPFRLPYVYCPYLVGSHEDVAEYLACYLRMGINTLILNEAYEEDDYFHAMKAITQAQELIAQG